MTIPRNNYTVNISFKRLEVPPSFLTVIATFMSQGLKRTGAHLSLLLHNDETTFKGKLLAKCNLCLLYNTNIIKLANENKESTR